MKDNLAGALDELSGSVESATISVMSQLTPVIREIAERVTGLVNAFNELPDGTNVVLNSASQFTGNLSELDTRFIPDGIADPLAWAKQQWGLPA